MDKKGIAHVYDCRHIYLSAVETQEKADISSTLLNSDQTIALQKLVLLRNYTHKQLTSSVALDCGF